MEILPFALPDWDKSNKRRARCVVREDISNPTMHMLARSSNSLSLQLLNGLRNSSLMAMSGGAAFGSVSRPYFPPSVSLSHAGCDMARKPCFTLYSPMRRYTVSRLARSSARPARGARFTCTEITALADATSLDAIVAALHTHDQCISVKHGIAIISPKEGRDGGDVLVPIVDGKVQAHVVTTLPRNCTSISHNDSSVNISSGEFRVHLCSFNTRACTTSGDLWDLHAPPPHTAGGGAGGGDAGPAAAAAAAPEPPAEPSTELLTETSAGQRPVDPARQAALNSALSSIGVAPAEFLPPGGKYIGTAPSRIYRSFVFPRANKKQALHPKQVRSRS